MIKFHGGYELKDKDFKDVRALCDKFGIEYPEECRLQSENALTVVFPTHLYTLLHFFGAGFMIQVSCFRFLLFHFFGAQYLGRKWDSSGAAVMPREIEKFYEKALCRQSFVRDG